jgi:hypothetical protein
VAKAGLPPLIVAVAVILPGWARLAETEAAAPPQLAADITAKGSGDPESQNGAEADDKHDDPPNRGRKTVHGVLSSPGQNEGEIACAAVNEV